MKEKLKSFLENDQYFYGFLVILVGIISFLLGQKSVSLTPDKPIESPVSIEQTKQVSINNKEETSVSNSEQEVVASKSGTKYHLESCPGANSIKEANRLVFASAAAARAAGYTPAANCKGLQ